MFTGPLHPSTTPRRLGQLSLLTLAMLTSGLYGPAVMAEPRAQASPSSANPTAFTLDQRPLASALEAFMQVTGWQVDYPTALVADVSSPGVHGTLPAEQALQRLLQGTGLRPRQLGHGHVVLEREQAGSAIALQQLTVSATRTPQDVASVPSTVSVWTREQLDRQNVNDIKQLVRHEPGVVVGGVGQRSGLNGYNIRGIDGERVLTQVDGVTVPDGFFYGPYAHTQRNYVDPEIVKRVEILRGPASVLYGSNAIGGAVSYFTLDPDDIIKPGQDVGARLKTGYSSADDSWLTSATVAGRQGSVDGLLHLSQRNGHETESYGRHGGTGLARTQANPQDVRTTNVLAKLGWLPAEDVRLGLTYERYKDDRDQNQLSAVGGPFDNGRPLGIYRSRLGNDTITRERFGIDNQFGLDTPMADRIKWSLNYQLAKTDQSTEEDYFPFSYRVLRTRNTTYKNRQWVYDLQLDKAFDLAATQHQVTYGATWRHERITGSRSGTATCLARGSKCPGVGADRPDSAQPHVSDFPDPTYDTYSLFVQDEIRWNDWVFLPGLRYDYTHLEPKMTEAYLRALQGDNEMPSRVDDASKTWHRLSPRLGVTYAFDEQNTWYAQYAEGFRTPTAKSLYGRFENIGDGYVVEPNPGLRPETSKGLETGVRGHYDAGEFSVAAFYNRYRDFIDENGVQSANLETTFQANNIKRATIQGAELKGRLNLDRFGGVDGLYSLASVAYQHGRNDDTGQPLNSVAPLTGVLGLGYEQARHGAQLSWTLVQRKQRVDDTQFYAPDGSRKGFRTAGYGVLDLTGFYKLTNDLTLNAGVYNLANKQYRQWEDVRKYATVGSNGQSEAAVTQPANLDRLTAPGRNVALNLVWDI